MKIHIGWDYYDLWDILVYWNCILCSFSFPFGVCLCFIWSFIRQHNNNINLPFAINPLSLFFLELKVIGNNQIGVRYMYTILLRPHYVRLHWVCRHCTFFVLGPRLFVFLNWRFSTDLYDAESKWWIFRPGDISSTAIFSLLKRDAIWYSDDISCTTIFACDHASIPWWGVRLNTHFNVFALRNHYFVWDFVSETYIVVVTKGTP